VPRTTFVTALAALSLQHVSTPATDEPVQRALRWLFDADAARMTELEAHAGEAGLALALAAGRPGREEFARELVGVLAAAISPSTGWWCGDAPGAYYRWQPPPAGASYAARDNLVDSQLVVLGLLAARKAGIAVPPEVWKRHAEGLAQAQSTRGGWPLTPTGEAADFSCGTYVGLANLLAARAAGGDSPAARAATERARRALARDATYTVTAPRGHFPALEDEEALSGPVPGNVHVSQSPTPETSTDPGYVAYVRLFSLGRACASADVVAFDVDDRERPGTSRSPATTKLFWFTRAGRWLLDVQDTSGGWSPGGDAQGRNGEHDRHRLRPPLPRAGDGRVPSGPPGGDRCQAARSEAGTVRRDGRVAPTSLGAPVPAAVLGGVEADAVVAISPAMRC
jgi:hypothetical protein